MGDAMNHGAEDFPPESLPEAALWWARHAWDVFPLQAGEKIPFKGSAGFKDATVDERVIGDWWRRNPKANIGLAIPSCHIALDIDSKEALEKLKAEGFDFPPTAYQKTPRGWHIIYATGEVELRQTVGEILPGIDTRVPGKGYVVAAPSVTADGGTYAWKKPLEEIAPAPAWLFERLAQPPAGDRRVDTAAVLQGVPKHHRDNELFRFACKLRNADVPRETAERLVQEAASKSDPPFPERLALAKVESAYTRYGPKAARRLQEGCKVQDSAAYAAFEAVCLADVEPEEVTFVWHPYIPVGKLTIIEGDPGLGKSFISAAIATALSLGTGLPGATDFEHCQVLFFTAEDGLGDTLRPRLDLMGADVSRLHAFDQPVDLSNEAGLEAVERMIQKIRPKVVFFDPIVAYLGAGTDIHRANQVRSVMAPLAALAEKHQCAIVVVRHISKAKGARAIYRGLGSIDFTAAARSVLLVGADKGDPSNRAMVHIKCNLAPLGPPLGYSIAEGIFGWTGESTLTAADLLGDESSSEATGAIGEAQEFLMELLKEGPVRATEVMSQARAAGIAERTLRDAKRREGIKAVREGYGKGAVWRWRLSSDADREPRRLQENTEGCKAAPLADNVQPSRWGEI